MYIETTRDFIDAINKYGSFKGIKLGIKRILKCHPKGKYGYDPVK